MLKSISVVALVAASAIGLSACGGPYQLTPSQQSTAELGARDYAERLGGTFISCSGQASDRDRDGYVTCGVSLKGSPADLLCSFKENTRGCKRK